MHVFYPFSASFYPQLHHNGKGSIELFYPEEALLLAVQLHLLEGFVLGTLAIDID